MQDKNSKSKSNKRAVVFDAVILEQPKPKVPKMVVAKKPKGVQ